MKFFIVLVALVAAVSAFPGYDVDPWRGSIWPSSGWQPQSAWPSSGSIWPSSGWQQPAWQPAWQPHVKPVVAEPHYPQHHVEHVQVLHVAQPPAVPPLHPSPLKLSSHAHVTRIPLHGNKVAHPHLIGVEHYHEPEIHIAPVHGHGYHH